MTTRYYDLKELIAEQLTRIDDEVLTEIQELKVSFVDPHSDQTPYYKITIKDFNGNIVVI